MTLPPVTPPTPDLGRPTLSMRVDSVADSIMLKLVGLATFVGSGYFIYLEFKEPPPSHTSHFAIFASTAVFGAAMMFTGPVLAILRGLVGIAGPYIPKFGKGTEAP